MIEKLCYVCMIVLLIILQLTQVLSITVFFLVLGVLALILAMRIGIFHQTQSALLVDENMPTQLQQQRRKQTAILALLLAVLFFVLAYIS
ncbi:hypothetical protein [uncultured Enterococcus sp.]|uniref:hypothetical protein n=1 Tax=uncultured Enterococcus sp. TaxID=167972 RepID=UPI0026248C18|nr:hypothetical protein [uncultured Enterococcus sp.]